MYHTEMLVDEQLRQLVWESAPHKPLENFKQSTLVASSALGINGLHSLKWRFNSSWWLAVML